MSAEQKGATARRVAYVHCDCGTLVRASAFNVETEQAKALAQMNSHAFAAECPACKVIVQLTFTIPQSNRIIVPEVVVPSPH